MGIATLATWMLTVGMGAYMLRTWIAHGGPQMQRARPGGLPSVVIYGHAGLAIAGLAIWIGYLATGLAGLAWSAAGLLMPVVGLGTAMVTVWTPYPAPVGGLEPPGATVGGAPGEPADDALAGPLTDEVLARALTDDVLAGRLADEVLAHVPPGPPGAARRHRAHLAPLVPAGHGAAALVTVLLAMVTTVNAR
ncbi:MAG TPA: hypothetical protein VGM53_05520 [Streptosporangiaceae bacterium]|jgi:hypothetical protein